MSNLNISDLPETLRKAYEDGSYHSSLDINQHGIWKIYSPLDECGNPDLLSIVEGTFINSLAFAVTIPNFNRYGDEFGHMEEYDMPNTFKVNDSHFNFIANEDRIKNENNLRKEKEELEKRLSEINKKLGT